MAQAAIGAVFGGWEPMDLPTCEGFTRPECQPCPETEDLELVQYDSCGELFKRRLCLVCRERLLIGSGAW